MIRQYLMLWLQIRLASLHRLARVRILGGGLGCSDHVEFENNNSIGILSQVFEKVCLMLNPHDHHPILYEV